MADFRPAFSVIEGDVDVSSQASSISVYGTQTGVGYNTETTVLTLTANGTRNLTHISCSGDAYAEWRLYVNTVKVETKRSGGGFGYNTEFTWRNPISLTTGTVVDVKVIHYYNGETATFNATAYGF
jgi:hypothetical protein